MNIKMVVTDLDGTLAKSDSSICTVEIETLEKLGELGVCRVIATGRSLFSARKVLTADFPIDYLVFSTGAGILNWKSQEILHEQHLPKEEVISIAKMLIEHQVDFSVQDKIPDNHCFSYVLFNQENEDFRRRLSIYEGFTRPLDINALDDASQIIAILEDDVEWFEELSRKFDDVKVIRATSPLNGKSIWMEFFPQHVSKSYGIQYLCELLQIDKSQTIGIGNDFNDIDLLNYCKYSFVVDNAPTELKQKYPSVASNDMNGFTDFINKLISS
ncbi:MAG: Cof-type HAD-IIB family hydrolase [Deltaproteobacteria bacterium]|nr:Cof-type HAD-IIB family hydrolase [Deltaproteobacteria bacterium]MCW9049899.1 Cof-type HAD-IIB family hydrolase [Deltaproteobacteria bacterium]